MKKLFEILTASAIALTAFTVAHAESGIINGDFSDSLNGWTTTENVTVSDGTAAISGTGGSISQIITIENGSYNLTADFINDTAVENAYLYAKTDSSTIAKTAIPVCTTSSPVTVRGIKVTDGTLEIGLCAEGTNNISMDNVVLSAAPEKETEFLKGGEISKLTYIEDMGGKFYDSEGNESDALQIMSENGFNLARIRVLNNPGKGRGDGTYYLPSYYQSEADCLHLARRARDKGMKIQFSFAYSDYWSDGAQQYVPSEWQKYITENSLTGEAMVAYLEEQVYQYTKKVMQALVAQDTVPEYVSIGNEMQYGILFGHYQNNNGLYNTKNTAAQVRFFNAGARAVRETSPTSKIILHSDNGGKIISKRTLFYNTFLNQVDCDIIGVSYYPYYNSDVSIDILINELNTMIDRYDKDVMIMETGYNWSEKRGDGWDGQLKDNGFYQNIYGETEEGQQAFLTELYAKLKTKVKDGRCIADLYWDPVMIYDGGTYKIGWAVKERDDWADGNVVSNSTIFDFNGKALPAQKAMKHNTVMNDSLMISGKITYESGNPVKNAETEITVNGQNYRIKTDSYGEYIATVPFSSTITLSSPLCENTFEADAPDNDFILYGADLTSIVKEFIYNKTSGKIELPEISSDEATVIAAFYKDGAMTRIEQFPADTADITVFPKGNETVKIFLWDNLNGMKPLSCEASYIR